MTRVCWLHLSDWHQADPEFDRGQVLERLLADIAAREEIDPRLDKVDFVVFSGDLAWAGKKEQYEAAEEKFLRPVLERVGVDPARLFVVPGNHDLDESRFKYLPESLKKPFDDERALQDWLTDPEGLENLLGPFRDFAAWAESFTGRKSVYAEKVVWTLENGLRVRIAGLNSALMCRRHREGADVNDERKLTVGEPQAAAALVPTGDPNDNEVRFVVQHHPMDWLQRFDEGRVRDRATAWADLALFGHNHLQQVIVQSGSGGACVVVPGGAAYDRRDGSARYANAYNFGLIDLDDPQGQGRIFLRRWEDGAPGSWVPDCRKPYADGVASFPLPERLHKKEALAQAAQASQDQRTAQGLQAYCDALFRQCDEVDLTGLPDQDRDTAERARGLRRLYVPLHVTPWAENAATAADDLTFKGARSRFNVAPEKEERIAAATFFADHPRAVIVGDPGAGKTTLTRWLAYLYLLRRRGEAVWREGAAAKLPDTDLIPVIIRCRDLDPTARAGGFHDMLQAAVKKTLASHNNDVVCACDALWAAIKSGGALVIVDGLDEIADAHERATFCEQVKTFAKSHPAVRLLATSRIVGYRAVAGRLGADFAAAKLAEFDKADKDDFVKRWCAAIEQVDADAKAAELIDAVRSNPNVEKLTGNPILLTTMALVKRRLGRLPQRRAKLYEEAVKVLLRWGDNAKRIDKALEEDEAMPQLGWLAFAMCERGVARLDEDEAVAVLEDVRRAWPDMQAIRVTGAKKFLRRVETQTGVLHQCGLVSKGVREVPAYEFRHLTFQEFFAARALAFDMYPGRRADFSVADKIDALAKNWEAAPMNTVVVEQWREALRLTVTVGDGRDNGRILAAMLGGNIEKRNEAEARAHLAVLALLDDPDNVPADVVNRIIDAAATWGIREAAELQGETRIARLWNKALDVYCANDEIVYGVFRLLFSLAQPAGADEIDLTGLDDRAAVIAALQLNHHVWPDPTKVVPALPGLVALLDRAPPVAYAAEEVISDFGEHGRVMLDDDIAAALRPTLRHERQSVRHCAVAALSVGYDDADKTLLSQDLDDMPPYLDPREPITLARCEEAAKELNLPLDEVKDRYRRLAPEFDLELAFD